MKKLVTILILLLVVGGGAYYYYSYGKTEEKPQVMEAEITQGDITEFVQATGTLAAQRLVDVGSQVSGIVKDVLVDYNSIVKEGQLLATIDPTLLQVQVELQSANVERQKGEIAIQEVQLEDAVTQLARTKQMFDKGLANQQQMDAANLTVKQRQTSLDSARKQLLTNEANLNQAKLNVSYTNIVAPIDGVIVNRYVDPGKAVQASMTTPQFFQIATDLQTLRLSAGVDEADIGRIRPGMRVNFTVDTYPNATFTGQVENVRLNATTQQNVVTYPIWINVPNPDLRLLPSMTATVRIVISTASNVLRVPNQALRFRPTTAMYTALGLTPPAAPAGRGGRNGGDAAGPAGAPAAGTPAAGTPAAAGAAAQARPAQRATDDQAAMAPGTGRTGRQGGDAAAGGQARQGGRGFGGGNFANLSPEERERMRQQFGGRGGRNGGPGGPGAGRGALAASSTQRAIGTDPNQKIDELLAPVQTRISNGQVWLWDEAAKTLTDVRVRTGVADNQFSQLVSGDIKAGQKLVTNIVLPLTSAQRNQQQNIFGNQPGRGGFGGPQQGGGGGGNRGGGRGGF